MKKERPILFSTPMVQAILEGRKTQTRRVIKPQPELMNDNLHLNWKEHYYKLPSELARLNPYGQPGDILWVRETWAEVHHHDGEKFIAYKADFPFSVNRWKPSIHMKKEHARIWLQVEDILVERVQDITEDDAIAEGVEPIQVIDSTSTSGTIYKNYTDSGNGYVNPVNSFDTLWVAIKGFESWKANPWVWVVKFKVLSTNGKPEGI